jgi:hypothetical protein
VPKGGTRNRSDAKSSPASPAPTSIEEFRKAYFPANWRQPVQQAEPEDLATDREVVGRALREFRRALAS